MSTVLVTGAAGLIGSEVCRHLIHKKLQVIGTDNHSDNETFPFVIADLSKIDFEKAFKEHNIKYVIHCAAHPGGKSLSEPVEDVEINSLVSMKLFFWCAKNQIEVIYLSSSAIYGSIHGNVALTEEMAPNPGTIYAACKVACENYLRILGEGYGLKWTVLRLFATYGSGHKANTFQGIVNIILTQILEHDSIVMKGSLERVRGLIYVKDTAEAIVQTLANPQSRGEIFNISNPEPTTIKSIIEILQELTNLEKPIKEEAGTVGDPMYNYADCSKAIRLLNFNPKYSLKEGLRELVLEKTSGK